MKSLKEEAQSEEVEVLEEKQASRISLKEKDDRLMTIDDFLKD